MKIQCSYSELLEVHKIIPHPKNPNTHSKEQIERLAKIIDYQGQRSPVVISKLSGFVVVGHGRFEAMKKLGWEKVAVDYQDFENEAAEYSHMTADNAIAEWASLDLSKINLDILDFGPEFDLETLGLKEFILEPAEKEKEDDEVNLSFDYKLEVDCENEDKQQMLLMELQDREFKVRVLL